MFKAHRHLRFDACVCIDSPTDPFELFRCMSRSASRLDLFFSVVLFASYLAAGLLSPDILGSVPIPGVGKFGHGASFIENVAAHVSALSVEELRQSYSAMGPVLDGSGGKDSLPCSSEQSMGRTLVVYSRNDPVTAHDPRRDESYRRFVDSFLI